MQGFMAYQLFGRRWGADNLRKVAGYDFHHLRKKYDVRTMWGGLDRQWRLLQSQLEARGPVS